MKLRRSDKLFSQYIRLRDMKCRRCGSTVRLNEDGIPNSHNCSHYYGRTRENVRNDPENADTLCFPCHHIWGHGDGKEEYKEFKIKQLGQNNFDLLTIRANMSGKRDEQLAIMHCNQLIKDLDET